MPTDMKKRFFAKLIPCSWLLAAPLIIAPQVFASTNIWTAASGTDTNWSTGGNWSGGVPAATDDVKFFTNTPPTLTLGTINNTVDALFGGTIGSLQYGNTNVLYGTQIANGTTLNITGANGLFMYTPADPAAAIKVTNVITGSGATLNLSNTTAVLSVNQGSATTGSLAALDMSGLDTFTGTIARLGLGSSALPVNGGGTYTGVLFLAKTNIITLSQAATLAAYSGTPGSANSQAAAIDISHNTGNPPKSLSILYLGQTNQINVDSIRCAGDKASSPTSAGLILFNPAFTNNSPKAVFRGTNGTNRVTWWTIGDMGAGASGSNSSVGTNDFSNGILDALIETLSLGRDTVGAENSATPIFGMLTYNAGVINVNTVYAGNQILNNTTIGTCSIGGTININGTATMLVNSNLVLGRTSIAAPKVTGLLNLNGGSMFASTISVGATSVTNNIRMTNATLVVTNTLATNANGLFIFALTNSVLGLTAPANGSLVALASNLVTGGVTNLIQLAPATTFFSSYPKQFPLIKYTLWTGVNNFGLTNLPGWAPGATLVSNSVNNSLDLLLPSDPRPIITGQPSPYSGSPGDNIATNFSVVISAGSVTPQGFQWYFTDGSTFTNALSGTTGPSGTSTISGFTSSSLSITDAQPADSGGYFVVITNVYGTTTSAPALLTISAGAIPPALTGPANLTVIQGNNASFTASVSGSPIPSLQWFDNNSNPIPGATTSSLIISNVQFAQNGFTYTLTASNSAGVVSSNATLTVIVPPVIVSQPQNLVVTNGLSASFSVSATGVPTPSFQWFKGAVPITTNATATTSNLVIAATSPTDTASYFVQVSNTAGMTNSVTVSLTVNSAMSSIAFLPANGATRVCYDTPLYITFNQAPVENTSGKIRIFNVTNTNTPVDTIDLSLGANGIQARSLFPGDSQAFNYFPVIITGNTAAIYPHSGVMTSNQTYYVTIDDGAFTDTAGAFFAGIPTSGIWQFTTKPTGAANPTNLIVSADGTGDFVTVQGAVDSIPANNTVRTIINIHDGNYAEIINTASKPNVTFRGQSRNGTIVGYLNNANVAPGGTTHARMAFKVNSTNIAIENMTVTNRTPVGGSQAEAIMVESGASRLIVNNATVCSFQDTFLANVNSSQAYVYNSLIQGQFDYVWGGGNLFFTNCELRTLIGNNGTLTGGNLTAARTDNGVTGNWPGFGGLLVSNGISFVKCQMTRITNTITATTLADANGSMNGLVAWINCSFDANYITPSAAVTNSQVLWEYGNSNLLNTAPVAFGLVVLTNNDPRLLAASSATNWLNGWVPQLAPNIIGQPSGQSVNAGQPASFTVSATGIPDATYQWQLNGTNVTSGGTSATLTISNPQAADAGSYQVIVSNSSGSVTSTAVTLTVNLPPVPGILALGAIENTPVSVSLAKLIAAATDPEGNSFTVSGVSALSTNNGTVTLDSTELTYLPPTNYVGADQFTYTLTDSLGASSVATVNVAVVSSDSAGQNGVGGIQMVGGNAQVTFAGIPNYTYHIQRTDNLITPNWVTLGPVTADAQGHIVFTDTSPLTGSAFYRTIYP